MVDGFFLNNEMTDFAFDPRDSEGRPAANAVAPGKRPRSSMVPAILLTRDGQFAGAIGSAGGNAILAYVAKSLVASVDWNKPMQQAIGAPNLVAAIQLNNIGLTSGTPVDFFSVSPALGANVIPLSIGDVFTKIFTTAQGTFTETLTVNVHTSASVNDVLLAVLTGALREWLLSRGEPVVAGRTTIGPVGWR